MRLKRGALLVVLAAGLSSAAKPRKTAPAIANLRMVDEGVYRGAQPSGRGWAALKALGVKTIVKLDLPSEGSDAEAEKLGITVIDAWGPPSDLGSVYGAPRPEKIRRAVEALSDPKLRPIFVHCLHGEDRTGLIVGLYRVLHDGYKKEDAYAEMRAAGFHPVLHGLHEIWEEFDGKTLPGTKGDKP